MSTRVSAYYLSPEGHATLRAEGLRIRAHLAARRAQRELQRHVIGTLPPFEPIAVGEVSDDGPDLLARCPSCEREQPLLFVDERIEAGVTTWSCELCGVKTAKAHWRTREAS